MQGCGGRVGDEGQKEGVLGLSYSGVPEDGQSIVEVMRGMLRVLGGPGYGEIVAKSIDNDDNSLVKGLGVPTAIVWRARRVGRGKRNWRHSALGFVVQDEARQEEAAEEEVNAQNVEHPVSL